MSTMTGSLPGLPPHSGLILYRMDVDEYESLAGAGVLKDPRVELIDGYLVRKMTKKPRHTTITEWLRDRLAETLPPVGTFARKSPSGFQASMSPSPT